MGGCVDFEGRVGELVFEGGGQRACGVDLGVDRCVVVHSVLGTDSHVGR